MPPDRCDAVVIGAGVEGLSAALTLSLAGKQVVCVDRRAVVADLGGWDDAWSSPNALRALGLFQHGVRLAAPAPHLSLNDGTWRVLWPEAARTARTLPGEEGDALLELAASLRRWRAALREPGVAARAMVSSLDLVRQSGGEWGALYQVLTESASNLLGRRMSDPLVKGLMLAMASRYAPISPLSAGSGPMMLALAPFFESGDQALRPVAGGARALTAALAAAFRASGGELALGHEVSEIQMEREAATGVALGATTSIKAGTVIAAVAPKRLTQGLLSTRRYGRLLSGLRSAPRAALAAIHISLVREPDLPEAQLGLWRGGVSVWLGATIENLAAAAGAMHERRLHDTPAVELRFAPGLRQAVVVSPFCPGELAEGPWTAARRDALSTALIGMIRSHWPHTHALIEEAELLTPEDPALSTATGAIFGGADRSPALDTLFGLTADAAGPLVKGVHLCIPRALDPDGQAGMLTAAAAAGLSGSKVRL